MGYNRGRSTPTARVLVTFPVPVKEAIVSELERRQISLNDFVVQLLAERFGARFTPSGRRPCRIASRNKQNVLLRMPPGLKYALQVYALERRSNLTDSIIRAVAEALDMDAGIGRPVRTSPFGGGPRHR